MKFQPLAENKKEELEHRHRCERDSRVSDRIKAVLLKSEGWTNKAIAQALRIHELTVRNHLEDWLGEEKLKPENGGSESHLDNTQSKALEAHLEEKTYLTVAAICAYVMVTFGKEYTVSGMKKWLKNHKFSYKHPKAVPAKADLEKQEEFIKLYLAFLAACRTYSCKKLPALERA